jgi:outer membrane protein assembly factor BamB
LPLVALAIEVAVHAEPTKEASRGAPDNVRIIASAGEANRYWPCWRGPTGQGLATGTYPDTWSDTDNVLWKADLPGQGNSSPIVWKDRIFLTTAYESGQRRAILCLSRANGKLLWQTFVPAASPEKAQDKNGFASGTPCTDGERIYASFGNHGVLCVDFDGKQFWHHSFGALDALHGTGSSPLLYRDRLIVSQERQQPGSFVACFDKHSGKLLWKTDRKPGVGWSTPVAVHVGDHDEIVVNSEQVRAFDPETGRELWNCTGNMSFVCPTPVVGHGFVYCCSGRTGPTLAIRPGGAGDVVKSHLAWKAGTGSPYIPSPLLYGDYLYMVNDIACVGRCYDARTGKLLWQERLGQEVREGFSSSPVGVDGKVFFTNDRGETFVLRNGPTFQLLHVNKLNATTIASPALVDGCWLFRTDRQLLCIGKKEP